MAQERKHSPAATESYEQIWRAYYNYEPETGQQAAFYNESLGQLNELGRDRRQRGLYAGSEVHPLVRTLLLGGGILTVLFSLLIPVRSALLQVLVTSLVAGLIAFSIFIALALQRPFTGELRVTPEAFESIVVSFEDRAGGPPCPTQSD